ncbi:MULTISPECIES: YraN family protein [unclassified Solwaraspora]|uniref:YraN family protein n=1 Tax=unclassified Solwaraspora TaxID=2627926 RepID=UPI00259AF5F5|nr:YraN family protein [Solwaraspora sp. WMMA2056]WJK40003.1 YraN family protein [Solwaraspora sp. WMMA2056]
MTTSRQTIGRYGERCAVRFLADAGLVIVDRNWRCPTGEIDIIARDGDTVVFCEVKTRRGDRFGTPAEAVTPVKAGRIRRLAAAWLAAHPDNRRREVRFDLVAVRVGRSGSAQVDHVPAAF